MTTHRALNPDEGTFSVGTPVVPSSRWLVFVAVILAMILAGIGGTIWFETQRPGNAAPAASPSAHGAEAHSGAQRVEAVHPSAGGIERNVEIPGSVHSFDFANLYSRVAGFLKVQNVDIGDRVKAGQLLAELDVPELLEDIHRRQAELGLATSQVQQSEAAIESANAEIDVANAMVLQAEAEVGRATAAMSFREKQYKRLKELGGLKAVDERLVDEKQDEYEASVSAKETAHAKVATAKSQVAVGKAKVVQARADLEAAKSKVAVAQAEVQKAQVLWNYSRIVSPYDGVVSDRTFHIGDFIQSADQGGGKPIFQVQKNVIMRLVTQVPDRDVAFVDVGDSAEFRVDALGGSVIPGNVSRFSNSEEERTRSMRTEIDLDNSKGKLRDGMYGHVLIHLQPANPDAVHIPSACLVGSSKRGTTNVFVCVNGKLKRAPVRVGFDNGVVVEVLEGLTIESQVVVAPSGDLVEGAAVEPVFKKANSKS